MIDRPILLMGGSGHIGRLTAQALRAAHPGVPLLIGGRDRDKAQAAAAEVGDAEGVALDLAAGDLGLGTRPLSAVATFFSDSRLAGLRFAHGRGLPHLGISSGVFEIAPEVAIYMHKPDAAAIVLGYEWLVGATTVATLTCAEAFARIDSIAIGALVDEQDAGGPAVAEDFERLSRLMPAALTRREGAWIWREGNDAKAHFRALDGTDMAATGFSSIDVVGLATATDAPDIRFDLANGTSSSRRRGEAMSTEILIDLTGLGRSGQPLNTRHALVHPQGAAPLTALGTAMLLARLTGLDGRPPAPAGLYFPYRLLDRAAYLHRLSQEGGELIALAM